MFQNLYQCYQKEIDVLWPLLKKKTEWNRDGNQNENFEKMKKMLTELSMPGSSHTGPRRSCNSWSLKKIIAKTKRWNFQTGSIFKQIPEKTEKQYSIEELEVFVVECNLQIARLYLLREKVNLYVDHLRVVERTVDETY